MQPATRDERAEVQANPLCGTFQVGDFAGFGNLIELGLAQRARPAILLQIALDIAGDVKAPGGLPRRKPESPERN